MKRFIFFAQASVFSVFAFSAPLLAQDSETAFPSYVVIGAFAHQENAIHFTDEAKHNRYPARFEMNPNRNLYYVYVLTTDDREYARAEALRLRSETKYFDAWVYSGVFGNIGIAAIGGEQEDFNPVTGQRLENVRAAEKQNGAAHVEMDSQPTSNQQQTTTNATRTSGNDLKVGRSDLTLQEERSDRYNSAKPNPAGTTAGRNNRTADGIVIEENSVQPDGTRQHVNGSPTAEEQTLTPSKPSAKRDEVAIQRQANATNAPANTISTQTNLDTRDKNADANPRQANVKEQHANARQVRSNEAVTNRGPSGARKGEESSEKTQEQGEGPLQSDRAVQEALPSEATTSLRSTSATETSEKSEDKLQVPGSDNRDAVLIPSPEGDAATTRPVVHIPPPVRQSTEPLTSEAVAGKNFYFHLYRADNLNTVPGEVDAIDFEKSRKMGTYPAHESVKVTMAGGKMKHISFVCQVFGYRKQQQEFDPESPSEQLYLDNKGNLVVPFELVRLQKGDIAIMYNVFFFKDAAVMRPESRYEVNNLLDLLVENPSYKIMIHGHTNGNASGKIIRMDKPGNFYSLTGTKQGFGSAKQLSEERATVIRDFLISSGISADRMQVKAWGGKKPIHDKHSVRAQENVRVEIEILSQ